EVIECHERLWHGIGDRVQAAGGGWLRPGFWWRVLRTYARLLRRYRLVGDYDVLIVGYPGQFDVFLARLLSRLCHRPLVWDILMSIYLVALERGLTERSRTTVNLIRQVERIACRLPDLLILDTAEYIAWFRATHDISSERFRLVPIGADDRIFRPLVNKCAGDGLFRVVYYGTFIPNHGVEYIVEAAQLLADAPSIRFELIGEGPDRDKAVALARHYNLSNVEFVDWLDKEELVKRVSKADVCLGVFGTTPQSLMTVHNKIYEGMAMARPVITGDSPAVRQALVHGEHLYLCKRANPQALADAVCALKANPDLRRRLAESGYHLYREEFDLQHNGARYAAHLHELVEHCHSQERC
ncbi:MAG: glycosyltransferase family 4 protein, partial [Chloroflexi bacterium]|nr:glycosyltransferase family 4 protein [Chloroflexota bacterium]